MNNSIEHLFDLTRRTIVVAGGAGQIGFAISQILAQARANVIIADIDTDMATKKLKRVEDPFVRDKISVEALDVTSRESIEAFYKNTIEPQKSIYGLVNSFHFKGDTRRLNTKSDFFASLDFYPLDAWEEVHRVNLTGTFLMCQGAIPYLRNHMDGGVILNISSTYGNVSPNKSIYGNSGINSPVAYASSKAAIINLTRYLATHLADDSIRVNVLSPGGVLNNQSEEFIHNYTQLTPMKRMAVPEDYQGAALFLLSDASRYMTGSNLIIDGGWTAW